MPSALLSESPPVDTLNETTQFTEARTSQYSAKATHQDRHH